MNMKLQFVEPGDGTRYRAAYAPINNNGGIFFAFGVGEGPLIGYTFGEGNAPSYYYFAEKFARLALTDDGARLSSGKWTMSAAYLVLCTLLGSEPFGGYMENVEQRFREGWRERLRAQFLEQA